MTLDLATITLRQAMNGLDNRDFSVFELTRETLLRIRATEPDLHAYVEVFEEDALKTSLYHDRAREAHKARRPLMGLPIGIKDIFDIAGKKTLCGSRIRKDVDVAAYDAETVHRLRRDGAIFTGKTVTQEFAAGVVSAPCRNPWDLDRIPGGSSGGSAASVAIGTCLGAIGSDTGGSIRIPASVTATVGLKPTYGRIPLKGVYPLSPALDTPGPIARSVADALILYLVIANRAGEVANVDTMLEPFGSKSLMGVRLGVPASFFTDNIQPDVYASFVAAIDTLKSLGAEVVEVEWAEAPAARSVAALINRVESSAVHHDHIRSDEADLIDSHTRLRFEVGALVPGDLYLRARMAREAVRDGIARLYARHSLYAIVAPTLAATAPRADHLIVDLPDGPEDVGPALTRLTMPWNATGQPVISLPCGFDHDELPIGLSIIGKPDDEAGISRIAHQYETATAWFQTHAKAEAV
ncbi:MAG: amidase [Chloroflexia bacterium]|nr:amidase [Chloroflexia bacterium]